jgi:uncharacterized protein YndB with AHSA1/START domain
MRYADGPSTEVAIAIAAPPSRVWELVTDIRLPALFSQELVRTSWLDGVTGPSLGARIAGRSSHRAIGEWETVSTVTAYEPERVFEWTVGDVAEPSAVWRYTLDCAGDDVDLVFRCRLGPGPSGLSAAIDSMPDKEERIIERRLEEHRANMTLTIEGIRELAEHPES